ncbi:MAG: hypothetical protein P4L36_21500 [Holophaga sp.]|nr:hypothetical protein [Holophaga sp.]
MLLTRFHMAVLAASLVGCLPGVADETITNCTCTPIQVQVRSVMVLGGTLSFAVHAPPGQAAQAPVAWGPPAAEGKENGPDPRATPMGSYDQGREFKHFAFMLAPGGSISVGTERLEGSAYYFSLRMQLPVEASAGGREVLIYSGTSKPADGQPAESFFYGARFQEGVPGAAPATPRFRLEAPTAAKPGFRLCQPASKPGCVIM